MKNLVRPLAGPVIAALGIWCAAGFVTVTRGDSALERLIVPASGWWAIAALGAAACVPGWRRRPALALPAMLSTLPWWPVPLPAVALVWTGALAWLPPGLALLAALLDTRRPPDVGGGDRRRSSPALDAALAACLTLVMAAAASWSLAPRLPTGDEPHYLVITQSLLLDGDLRIENNHERRDYAAYFPGTLRPHYIRHGQDGEIYSIHAPGVAALVLPAFALFGYPGAKATFVLLTALAGGFVWLLGWRATLDRCAAWFAWASVAGAATFLIQGVTIFPDGAGAVIVAAALVLLWRLERRDAPVLHIPALIGTSALLAALPWLHSRFAVLAAGFGLIAAGALLRDSSVPLASRLRRLAAFMTVPAAAAAAWFLFFATLYGTASPSAPYGENPEVNPAYIPGGVAGLLFDQQFGLLAFSPVLALAAGGLVLRSANRPAVRFARSTSVVAFAYLAATATYWMWWAGVPAPPARFAAAVLPVLAVPVALGWQRLSPVTRPVWTGVLAISIAITVGVIGIGRGALAWNTRDGFALLLGWTESAANLHRGFPSFFWRLVPGDVRSEVPFALHILVWLAAFGLLGWGLSRASRRMNSAQQPVLAVWLLPVGLMTAAQGGWWLHDAAGLDAPRSQLSATRLLDAGRPGVVVAPLSIRWPDTPAAMLRVPLSPLRGDSEAPATVALSGLPAGAYALILAVDRPVTGTVALRLGRSFQPFQVVEITPGRYQSVPLHLPAGAERLTLEFDDTLAAAIEAAELAPVRLGGSPAAGLARASLAFEAGEVFFLDGAVFPEPDGFWVRGGLASDLFVAAAAGRTAIGLELSNGAVPNAVAVDVGPTREVVALEASETRVLLLHVPEAGLPVRVSSPAGFRPSEHAGTGDTRYLGVRVRLADPPGAAPRAASASDQ